LLFDAFCSAVALVPAAFWSEVAEDDWLLLVALCAF
jgi:hypothetical protein